jgi:F0F1-type ATP synthase assembly protein I
LDNWLGTKVLFVILGLVFGLIMAGLQLMRLVKKLERNNA